MHNLFLGDLHHHCIEIWGLKTAEGRGKPKCKQAIVHSPDMQQSTLDRLVAALRKGSFNAVRSTRKDYLEAVVEYNPSIVVEPSEQTKVGYASKLLEWVSLAPAGVDSLLIPPVLPFATNQFHLQGAAPQQEENPYANSVFTGTVLAAIRQDIAAVTLPSWLPRPPRNLGSASHGKLKADQWRTVCTVNMVITLIRLWSASSATNDEKLALANFLHLVAAVDLATRYSMSAERARRFNDHMLEYTRGLRSLYGADLVPNHHLSLHLADCLLLFGPTFSWWAFPFERYNGLLQKLNTNHKPADMPKTFMRSFYIGARLRWMVDIDSQAWPDQPEFRDVLQAFHSAFQDAARGSRAIHSSALLPNEHDYPHATSNRTAGKEEVLGRKLYDVLLRAVNTRLPVGIEPYASRYEPQYSNSPFLPSTAIFSPSITHAGVTIATHQSRPGNSFVLFREGGSGNPSRVCAGQVHRIFQHTRTQGGSTVSDTYLVVKQFRALSSSHVTCDPYRRFPDVYAWLCYNETDDTELIVPLSNFVSHFASYVYTPAGIERECIVVKLLDRVSMVAIRFIVDVTDPTIRARWLLWHQKLPSYPCCCNTVLRLNSLYSTIL
ncbi:hypothetical protein GY45DRAFT_1260396 [Cubamyces sp. BRFM 1775]|nr:hypothetical protein GY45DRAFT_1260396 [Cubamyces sp. BRFM 1775]